MFVRCNSKLAVAPLFEVRIEVEAYASSEDVDASNGIRGEIESSVPALREDAERQLDVKPSSEIGPDGVLRWETRQEEVHQLIRAGRGLRLDR